MIGSNLFANLPQFAQGEDFQELLRARNVRIERIVSGERPDPILYDQRQDEWVLLLQGQASLDLAGRRIELEAGDYLFIPRGTPHRVLATSRAPQCIWLAVHIY